jgi:TRAP-type C4-dicarboxylate transport system substrate-binding protein
MTELANAISLPGFRYKDTEHASAVMYQIYQEFPSIQAEFKDVHVLTTWCDGHQVALTRSKQIKTLDDLKGLKMRDETLKTPIRIPISASFAPSVER